MQFPITDAFFITVCPRSALKRSTIEIVLDRVPVRRLNQRFPSTSRYSLLPLPYAWIHPTLLCPPLATGYYSLSIRSRLRFRGAFPSTIIDEISRNRSHCSLSTRPRWGSGRSDTYRSVKRFITCLLPSTRYNRWSIISRNSDSSALLLVSSVLFRNYIIESTARRREENEEGKKWYDHGRGWGGGLIQNCKSTTRWTSVRWNAHPIQSTANKIWVTRASNSIPNTGRREGSEEAKKGKTRWKRGNGRRKERRRKRRDSGGCAAAARTLYTPSNCPSWQTMDDAFLFQPVIEL